MRSARARRGIGKAEVERALNAPRVVLNDRDYLLGAFSAAAVIVGATKPWVAERAVSRCWLNSRPYRAALALARTIGVVPLLRDS